MEKGIASLRSLEKELARERNKKKISYSWTVNKIWTAWIGEIEIRGRQKPTY